MSRNEPQRLVRPRSYLSLPGVGRGLVKHAGGLAILASGFCFILAFLLLIGFFHPFSPLMEELIILFLFACVPLFLLLSSYLPNRREQLLDYLNGDGSLIPVRMIIVDLSKYALLECLRLFAAGIEFSGVVFTALTLPMFVTATIIWIASLFVLFFNKWIGGIESLLEGSLVCLCFGIASWLSVLVVRKGRALGDYFKMKLVRFHNWDGVIHVGLSAKANNTREGLVQRVAERFDLALDSFVFPPAVLVRPDYVRIVEDKCVESQQKEQVFVCMVCGQAITGPCVRCARCETPHHVDCWNYTNRCSVYGCGSTVAVGPVLRGKNED